ncbi:MAG: hypothetical protein ABEK04_06275, partial [Candidatus Nanohalobium sp.]
MVSLMDAVFMPVAALFVVFFIVPALILAPQKSADFASVTSRGTMEIVVPSMMMTYVNTVGGDNKKNYKDISYKLSGKPSNPGLDKTALYHHPLQLTYLKVTYYDPHEVNTFSDELKGSKKLD